MVQRKWDALHEFHGSFMMSMESSVVDYSTIIPILFNDDAQGDPMSLNVNPEHASWAERDKPNCYPDSEIRNLKIGFDLFTNDITGGEVSYFDFEYALIACAFPEDLDAIDEKSGLSIKTIVELQKETTDRQCFPLFNTVKLQSGSALHDEVDGLTTTQVIEAVAWDSEVVRDQMRYGKVKGLLKKILPIGIRRMRVKHNLSKGGIKSVSIKFQPSNTKFINPYTFLGLMIRIPQTVAVASIDRTFHQLLDIATTTANASDIHVAWHVSFNERHPDFHMAKV